MCGIGGIVYWDGRNPSSDAVSALVQAQRHRGPDGDGIWTAPGVSLMHNRLAIIDLETGQQPMTSADGRLVITYNGELYNFRELRSELEVEGARFRTASDTEVVLAAYERWGEGALPRLRGMYAFAIWNTEARSLLVARDRAGIKPLYYARTADWFAFSSELGGLRALDCIDARLDVGALDLYLHYQYIQAPYTIYTGAQKLKPAHAVTITAASPCAEPRPYWRLQFEPDRSLSEDEWLERVDAEIAESVKCHLVSDVPFGAFLSGGVDSSLVAYHMSRQMSQPVRTFTIGFDDAAYDERDQAAVVARAIGADHHCEVVHVDKYDLLDDLIYTLARHYGEPFADSSAIPTYCVSAVARAQVKMVLSGDGGDELFAGYNTYAAILGAMPGPAAKTVPWWRQWRPTAVDHPIRARALAPPSPDALAGYDIYYAYFRDDQRQRLYRPETFEQVRLADHHRVYRDIFEHSGAQDCLSALQHLDINTYLPGDILTKVDVAAMAHSLEVRVPLLDHRVIELAARVPPELKLFAPDGALCQKYLLKRYANRVLPGDAFARPKHGFGIPLDAWFSGSLYGAVRDRLSDTGGIIPQLFSQAAIEELVATPDAARQHAPRIWALLFLQAWAAAYRVAL
jgi:asparagine synthase (glutamine-hydrolysing)